MVTIYVKLHVKTLGLWIQTAYPAVTILSVLPELTVAYPRKSRRIAILGIMLAKQLPAIDQRRVLAGYPSNRTRWNNDVLMLGQRLRRWANIKT